MFISDDSWIIPGLGGFPGPYMRYVNEWFNAEDWLRLTASLKNRDIILEQIIVYTDSGQQKLFVSQLKGVLLSEIRGTFKHAYMTIASFDGGQHSGAELNELGDSTLGLTNTAWHQLFEWLITTRT
jgi:XTP/dITP diphosphohydrolase